MASIEVSRRIGAARHEVWEHLSDLSSHAEWMKDALEVTFLTERRRGTGTVMRVPTAVGPLRTTDLIEVTGWDEGRSIEVAHKGLITGHGALSLKDDDSSTVVTWTEKLRFPWWFGGPAGALIAKPFLAALWRGNLRRLEDRIVAR